MESIVKDIKQRPAVKNDEYLTKLRAAGFVVPASEYPIITLDAIHNYLKVKTLEKYNKGRIFRRKRQLRGEPGIEYDASVSYEFIDWGGFFESVKRYRSRWNETDISECYNMPPLHVLNAIERAKKSGEFTAIHIVTVTLNEQMPLPDPLVVGRKANDENRYLIDYWDTDINPNEIETK